ncbi:hypothetical protein GCM10010994_28770 [Chelatococcus reniformis]|uniref:Uncharacterized protein n=1 Tax=Chelatococcus reniformis TaxID=1494448 RepID=A0A916UCB1_9HYPH|nr:hypothetical protein GCM10010994_28770 [Chelatococcus reniformis]
MQEIEIILRNVIDEKASLYKLIENKSFSFIAGDQYSSVDYARNVANDFKGGAKIYAILDRFASNGIFLRKELHFLYNKIDVSMKNGESCSHHIEDVIRIGRIMHGEYYDMEYDLKIAIVDEKKSAIYTLSSSDKARHRSANL